MGGLESVLLVSVLIQAKDLATQVFRRLGINANSALGVAQIGALAVAGGITAVAVAATDLATQFDQSMHRIGALTDTSQAQMQAYQDAILAMSPALDQAPKDLADGLYFVISAGYSGSQALNILSLSAKAAAATFTPMKNVADLLTTAMNAYRGANLSAGHAMDDIVKVVVNGKVTMSSLATSFGFVGVTAHAAGLSFDEASAAVSTLSQIAGEHGSRRVMMDLDNLLRGIGIDVDSVAKHAKSLGLKFDESKFAAMGFIEKLQYLATISGGVGYNLDSARIKADLASGNMDDLALATANANSKFKTLVGGAAAFIPAFMLLSDKGSMYNQILKQMGGNGQATANAFDIMRQSTGQQIRMFEMMSTTILTSIGLHILPVLNQMLGWLYKIGEAVNSWLAKSSNWETLKTSLIGIAVVVGTVLLPALVTAAMAAAPFVLAIAGIILLGIKLGPIIEQIVAHFGGLSGIMSKLHPLIVLVQNAFQAAGQEIAQALANPQVHQALQQLQQALPQLIPYLQVIAVIVGVTLVVAFQLALAILRGLIGALPGLIQYFRGIIEVIGAIGRIVKDVFTGNFTDILPAVQALGQGVADIFVGALRSVLGFLGGFGQHILEALGLVHTQTQQHHAVVQAAALKHQATLNAIQQLGLEQRLAALKRQHAQLEAEYARAHTPTEKAHINRELMQNDMAQVGTRRQLGEVDRRHAAILAKMHQLAEASKNPLQKLGDGAHLAMDVMGQHLQQGVEHARQFVQGVGTHIAAAGHWLYQHNYYVKGATDFVTQKVNLLKAVVPAALQQLKDGASQKWKLFQAEVEVVWNWVHDHIVKPVGDALNKVLTVIGSVKDAIGQAFDTAVVQPIQMAWSVLVQQLSMAGSMLMKMIGDDIRNGAHWVADAAKAALGKLAGWLGFHSPAPNVPESAQWGANLVKMFAQSMLTQQSALALAGSRLLGAAGLGSAATAGLGAVAGRAAGASTGLAGAAGMLSAGNATHNHYWAGAFPNATDRNEIAAALNSVFNQRQTQDYRRARRAQPGGLYGGIGVS